MKNIAIVYKSILGSAKNYATWLTETLRADLYTYGEVKKGMLKSYDVIVVLSGTYAAQMPLINFLKKHWDEIGEKKVIAVAVGIAPADDPQSKKSYDLIPEYLKQRIIYFKLPGKFFGLTPGGKPIKENLDPIIKEVKSNLDSLQLYTVQ